MRAKYVICDAHYMAFAADKFRKWRGSLAMFYIGRVTEDDQPWRVVDVEALWNGDALASFTRIDPSLGRTSQVDF